VTAAAHFSGDELFVSVHEVRWLLLPTFQVMN